MILRFEQEIVTGGPMCRILRDESSKIQTAAGHLNAARWWELGALVVFAQIARPGGVKWIE